MPLIKKLFKFIVYFPVIPACLLIIIIRPFVLIRFGELVSERIGHFACVAELYLSKKNYQNKKKIIDFFCVQKFVCNNQIYKFIKKKLYIIPRQLVKGMLFWLNFYSKKKSHDIYNCQSEQENYNFFHHRDTSNILDKTNKNFFFTTSEITLCKNFFKKKINLNLPIVVFFIRDNSFFQKNLKFYNSNNLMLKNPELKNYKDSIKYLLKNGYTVVRIGKDTKRIMKINNRNFYDLSKCKKRTDLYEAYIASKCKFIFGSNSGALYAYAYLFRKPCFVSNYIPYGLIHSYSKLFYYNFKKFLLKKNKKILTLSEIFNNGLGFNEGTAFVKSKKVEVLDQNSDEILNSLKDFIKYINNNFVISKIEKNLKKKFLKNYLMFCKNDNFFCNIHGEIKCNFGLNYLKKNKFLYK